MPRSKTSAQIQKFFLIVVVAGLMLGAVMGVGVVWFISQWNLNAPPTQQR